MRAKLIKIGLIIISLAGILAAVGCLTSGTTTTTSNGTSSGSEWWTMIIFIVVIFGLMYLLMIRPQRRRQKEQQKMMDELVRGDEVITAGGIYGKIETVEENSFVIKLESGALMRVARGAISGKRPKDQV